MNFLKNKPMIRGILGISLIVLAIIGIFVWENYGKEAFTYENVIVLKEEVNKGDEIKANMLTEIKVDKSTLINGLITNENQVVGKTANNFIPAKLQLSSKFFGEPDLAIGDGKYIFSVPTEWVYSYPGTLRREDTIYFYPIKIEEDLEKYNDIYNQGYFNQAVKSLTESAVKVSQGAIVIAKVAYVKDSGNREVVDVIPENKSNLGSERIDASAAASNIEIVINETDYNILKDSFENGYKFILMYE